MRHWFFFAGSAVMGLLAFINYILLAGCQANMPFAPIPSEATRDCLPLLEPSFYLFALATISLFFAFIFTLHEKPRK
jgi:hypothetical protein